MSDTFKRDHAMSRADINDRRDRHLFCYDTSSKISPLISQRKRVDNFINNR